VTHLRDISLEQFTQHKSELDDLVRKRCHHVITENERTQLAAQALLNADAAAFGQLMNDSHESLCDDFEVSCDELNVMVNCARKAPDCLGARMTGAGFGGCAVALVEEKQSEEFVNIIRKSYSTETGLSPNIYVCCATDGARAIVV
jgi:galactokinase